MAIFNCYVSSPEGRWRIEEDLEAVVKENRGIEMDISIPNTMSEVDDSGPKKTIRNQPLITCESWTGPGLHF